MFIRNESKTNHQTTQNRTTTFPLKSNIKRRNLSTSLSIVPRVRFQRDLVEVDFGGSPSSPLDKLESVGDWGFIWYNNPELESMRSDVHDECQRIQNNFDNFKKSDSTERLLCSFEDTHSIRGLEQRLCKERQRRKIVAIKYLVKTAARLQKEHEEISSKSIPWFMKLGALAERCNAWAISLAIEQASFDYKAAYGHECRSHFLTVSENTPNTNKRTHNGSDGSRNIQRQKFLL